MKALIVDDQTSIRGMLKTVVSRIGFDTVLEAADGEKAVEVYRSESPDFVLMDINMPKVTGLEALKEIITFDPNAVVCMLTSQDTAQVVRTCVEEGATHFILKNSSPDKLQQEISKLVNEIYE